MDGHFRLIGMKQTSIASAKTEEFAPLMPIDVIRPPHQRGDFSQPDMIPPQETPELIESELEDQETPTEDDLYKGDRNAPAEAPHPLTEPSASPEPL